MLDDVDFLRNLKQEFELVNNPRKIVGEWEVEIEGISSPVKIRAYLDSNGKYWAIPSIEVNGSVPEGRAMSSPEEAVSECLIFLLMQLKSKSSLEIKRNELY